MSAPLSSSQRIVFPDTPIVDPWQPTYLPLRELAACGHYGCPTYRCFYDGLCEHNWGEDNDCRLPIDKDGWGNYCTFHGEVELARAAREYGEDNVCMTDQQRAHKIGNLASTNPDSLARKTRGGADATHGDASRKQADPSRGLP